MPTAKVMLVTLHGDTLDLLEVSFADIETPQAEAGLRAEVGDLVVTALLNYRNEVRGSNYVYEDEKRERQRQGGDLGGTDE